MFSREGNHFLESPKCQQRTGVRVRERHGALLRVEAIPLVPHAWEVLPDSWHDVRPNRIAIDWILNHAEKLGQTSFFVDVEEGQVAEQV